VPDPVPSPPARPDHDVSEELCHAWARPSAPGRVATQIRRAARRIGVRLLAGRRGWHNRVFDSRFLCLPDEAHPDRGFMVWEQRYVFPVTHAAAGPGLAEAGRSCHLIASGPSLLAIPARHRLLDRYSVVVNGAHAAVDRGGRRFDLYVVTDPRFVRDKWELFCAGLDSARAFAADHRVFVEVLERDPQVLVGRRLVLFTNLRCPYRMRRDNDTTWCAHPGVQVGANGCGFSANLELGVFPGETVVFPCLELLCGWNFREIFVFGLDLSSGRRSYAEADPAPSLLARQYEEFIEPSLRLAAQVARARGIAIWNCSPTSVLPESILPKLVPEWALRETGSGARESAPLRQTAS